MFGYLLSYYFDWLKLIILLVLNHNLAQPTATLLVGFGVTLVINRQQIQISKANRKQDLEISKANREQDLRISQENNEQEILQKYVESIEKLLLDYQLNKSDANNQYMNIARFKTLTVLRRLKLQPGRDKTIILKFLYDTELIKIQNDDNKKISKLSLVSCDFHGVEVCENDCYAPDFNEFSFDGVDFNRVNLSGANFSGSDFSGTSLYKANLSKAVFLDVNFFKAILTEADLTEADISYAEFTDAELIGAYFLRVQAFRSVFFNADISYANFTKATLSKADFSGSNLYKANFSDAILYGTYFYQVQYLNINQLKSAENWEQAIYTEAEWDDDNNQWIPKDKAANEAKIEEIRDSVDGIVKF